MCMALNGLRSLTGLRAGRGPRDFLRGTDRPETSYAVGEKQRIIAMVCSDPPAGRARWTVRLIAQVTPRSASRSSTSRKLKVKRWYNQTTWLMISGGKR